MAAAPYRHEVGTPPSQIAPYRDLMAATWVAGDGWYVLAMLRKTSLYIDADVDRGLARIAARDAVTKAEAIRRILAEAVAALPPRPRIAAIGLAEGPGDLVDNIDKYMEGFGE